MAQELIALTPNDVVILKDLLAQVRSNVTNRLRNRHALDQSQSPEVYLGYSQAGIPVPLIAGTSSGSIITGQDSIFYSDPQAIVFQFDPDSGRAHPVDGLHRQVYSTVGLGPNSFFLTARDKFGTWWHTGGGGGAAPPICQNTITLGPFITAFQCDAWGNTGYIEGWLCIPNGDVCQAYMSDDPAGCLTLLPPPGGSPPAPMPPPTSPPPGPGGSPPSPPSPPTPGSPPDYQGDYFFFGSQW